MVVGLAALRVHWHEGDSCVYLTYTNNVVEMKTCLFGSSNLPETTVITQEVKANNQSNVTKKEKPMKNRFLSGFKRWVRASAITVSLGSFGAVHLQPNAL